MAPEAGSGREGEAVKGVAEGWEGLGALAGAETAEEMVAPGWGAVGEVEGKVKGEAKVEGRAEGKGEGVEEGKEAWEGALGGMAEGVWEKGAWAGLEVEVWGATVKAEAVQGERAAGAAGTAAGAAGTAAACRRTTCKSGTSSSQCRRRRQGTGRWEEGETRHPECWSWASNKCLCGIEVSRVNVLHGQSVCVSAPLKMKMSVKG